MHKIDTTNGRIALVQAEIEELIEWADADAEHAAENDAPDTARDDRRRANTLVKIRTLLKDCLR